MPTTDIRRSPGGDEGGAMLWWNKPHDLVTGQWGDRDDGGALMAILRAGGDPGTIRYRYEDDKKVRLHIWEATAPWWRYKLIRAWWRFANFLSFNRRACGWAHRKARQWWVTPHLKHPASS